MYHRGTYFTTQTWCPKICMRPLELPRCYQLEGFFWFTIRGWSLAALRSNTSATRSFESCVLDAVCLRLASLLLQHCFLSPTFEVTCVQLVMFGLHHCSFSPMEDDWGCLRRSYHWRYRCWIRVSVYSWHARGYVSVAPLRRMLFSGLLTKLSLDDDSVETGATKLVKDVRALVSPTYLLVTLEISNIELLALHGMLIEWSKAVPTMLLSSRWYKSH